MIVKGGTFDRPINNILIIQLGDIGDVVWATPTFRAVKETYPQANVSILVREGFGSLLESDPHINRIFEIKHYKGNPLNRTERQIKFIMDLRKARFDLAFDLRSDDRGAFMSLLSGAPIRASNIYRNIPWRNWFFTHLADPPPQREKTYGAAEQSLCIIREFGIKPYNNIPKLWISQDIVQRVAVLLAEVQLDKTGFWITINPFSRWKHKEWKYDKWVEITNCLWNEYNCITVLVGSREEVDRAAAIVEKCCGRVINLCGKTSLAELAGFLSLSHLHIGVDSAAPHIAAAVGAPTITVYGPSDWRDWAPQGRIHSVIIPESDCSPCHRKGCDDSGKSRCLEELETKKVMSSIRKFLENNNL